MEHDVDVQMKGPLPGTFISEKKCNETTWAKNKPWSLWNISIFIYIYVSSVCSRLVWFVLCSLIFLIGKNDLWNSTAHFHNKWYLCAHSFCIFSIIFHYRGLRLFLFICITAFTIHQITVAIILLYFFFIYVFCSSTPNIFSKVILFSQSVAVHCLVLFPSEEKMTKKREYLLFVICIENRLQSINSDGRFWVF